MADPKSYIGATFQAVVATPATVDASGFGALAYTTTIGKVISLGALGDTHSDINVTTIAGRTFHQNGPADGGEVPLTFAYDAGGDAGQQLMSAQNGTNNTVSFKVTDPDGKISYIYAVIANFKDGERNAQNMKTFICTLRVNSPTIRPSL